MNDKTQWTEADFEAMSWHDCLINSIGLDQDGEWQSDLVLELDYIVEWLCGVDKRCRFRVAPALLRFTDVDNLRLDISLKFGQPLEIYHVERTELPATGYKNDHWILTLQNYSDLKKNLIEFDATGFVQELTGKAIETESQNLTNAERAESRKEWRIEA
ncbi:MAG: hypothetical protein ACOX5G_10595 [Kiritimatiellia bacterium]|jgi:hypothetical protein